MLTFNQKTMKKIFFMACVAASLAACNNAGTDENTPVGDNAIVTTDSATLAQNTTPTIAAYTPAEGDVSYRSGNLMVWKGNEWVKADGDVKLDNGIIIYKNGEVKKEDRTITLKEGEVVDRSGNFFDDAGHAINDAWDATKQGVSDAGKAIGDAAKDAKDAVVPDKNNK